MTSRQASERGIALLGPSVSTVVSCLLAGGRPHEAAETATFLVSGEPLDEPSHLLLMRAFGETGAPSRAAEPFRDLRRRLRRELGVEPAPELAALAGQPAYGS
ncbi:BTAD domain-containing putative transcriptional regulator [Streptomyces swartbergensis]|uniref:BTAD domain-containing putative transcriptional regulator n=1 Tax=Streptomyces swartbergensis TaxID=487165 RepID=UPI00381F9579